jgi:hypothetical protein
MTDILTQIPSTVLSQVRWALGTITRFNDAIRQCHATHAYTGSSGRYEWEYRTGMTGQTRAAQAQKAVSWLETFAECARQLGIDPEAVLAALEGETTPLPWAEAARAWLDREPGEAAR